VRVESEQKGRTVVEETEKKKYKERSSGLREHKEGRSTGAGSVLRTFAAVRRHGSKCWSSCRLS
jgi:hypothetical protein